MGTATSLWAAVINPSAIDAMILVVPPTAWETRQAQRELHLANAEIVANHGITAYLDAGDARPLVESLGSAALAVRQATRSALAGSDPASFAHALRGAAASNFPTREQIAGLKIPALILSWDGDPQHPTSTAEQLADLLQDSVLYRAHRLDQVLDWRKVAAQWLHERL